MHTEMSGLLSDHVSRLLLIKQVNIGDVYLHIFGGIYVLAFEDGKCVSYSSLK